MVRPPMIRDPWFWEVEVVRLEDGEPAARPRRLDFSVRPFNYLIGGLVTTGLAGAVVLALLVYPSPYDSYAHTLLSSHCTWRLPEPNYYSEEPRDYGHCCGGCYLPGAPRDVITPLRSGNDSTLLVRRLP
jgi:hypothetical protein